MKIIKQKINRLIALLLIVVLAGPNLPWNIGIIFADDVVIPFSGGGSGTYENPYVLKNIADFILLQEDIVTHPSGNVYNDVYFKVDSYIDPDVATGPGVGVATSGAIDIATSEAIDIATSGAIESFALGEPIPIMPLGEEGDGESEGDEGDEEDEDDYDLVPDIDLTETVTVEGIDRKFTGIGDADHVFCGKFAGSGTRIKSDTPLFNNVGDNAEIEKLTLFGEVGNQNALELSTGALVANIKTTSLDSIVTIADILVRSNVTGNLASTGGLIGTFDPSVHSTLQLMNIKVVGDVGNNSTSNGSVGGILGEVKNSDLSNYIEVCIGGMNTIGGNFKNSKDTTGLGGLIGNVARKVEVNLDGTFDFQKLNELDYVTDVNSGYMFGTLNYSYIHKISSTDIKKPSDYILNKVSEIGKGGTIYNEPMLSNESGEITKLAGKGTVDDPYRLSNPNDFMIMAIALNTQIDFAKECFDYSGYGGSDYYQYLLQANYVVTQDVDLTDTGILRLNIPFGYNGINKKDAFCGTFTGSNESVPTPTITLDIETRQDDVGLFAFVRSPNTVNGSGEYTTVFDNFKVAGTVSAGVNAASVYVKGFIFNDQNGKIAVRNVTSSANISTVKNGTTNLGDSVLNPGNVVGGLCGLNSLNQCSTKMGEFEYTNTGFDGEISGLEGCFGGLLGYYCAPRTYNRDIFGTLTIDGYTFSGTIKSDFTMNNQNAKVGGLVAFISAPSSISVSSDGFSHTVYYNKTKVSCKNITMQDASVLVNSGDCNTTGGMFGYQWTQVDTIVDNLLVKDSILDTSCYLGGLLYQVTGKMKLSHIRYDHYIMKNTNSGRQLNGGMIRVSAGANVTVEGFKATNCAYISPASYFNDFVGYNIGSRITANDNAYFNKASRMQRGIVNIEDCPEYNQKYSLDDTAENPYSVYVGQIPCYENETKYESGTKKTIISARTQIQYNLYKDWDKEENKIKGIGTASNPFLIENETQLMMLATFNSTDYRERYQLLECFSQRNEMGNSSTVPQTKDASVIDVIRQGYYVFTKDFDLSSYSYYPMFIIGGKYYGFNIKKFCDENSIASLSESDKLRHIQKAIQQFSNNSEPGVVDYRLYKPTIIFNAKRMIDKAPLFNNSYYTGRTSPNDYNSYHIFMQSGLFTNVVSYRDTKIEMNNLKFEGTYSCISNQDYERDVRSTGGVLITKPYMLWLDVAQEGQLYGINRAKVAIKNMEIGNLQATSFALDGGTSTYGAGLLVSDIYNSDVEFDGIRLTSDSTAKADALIGAAGGNEMSITFQHMKLGKGSQNKVENFRFASMIYHYSSGMASYFYDDEDILNNDYTLNTELPYAYKKIPIIVNPRNFDITCGDGTKSNPFIITKAEQLLTLSTFFISDGELPIKQHATTYDPADANWYVGDYEHNVNAPNLLEQPDVIDILRTSYYKLANDIDFNHVMNEFKDAAWDFQGIGTESQPFAGVLDGDGHSIILSQKGFEDTPDNPDLINTVNDYDTYGLFKYIKGAYVKNLVFSNLPNYINWKYKGATATAAASVATYAIGGDNIIEDVVLDNTIYIKTDGTTIAGGYVGYLKGGTLRFRNMQHTSATPVNNFKLFIKDSATTAKGNYSASMVGKVFNGCVLWEGYGDNSIANVPFTDSVFHNQNLVPSKSTGFVNGTYLDSSDKIEIKKNSTTGYEFNIKNTKELFITSLAINSGSFSTYGDKYKENYYDTKACTQKANSDSKEFNNPMLYQYFTLNGTDLSLPSAYKDTQNNTGTSYLNTTVYSYMTDLKQRTTYNLIADDGYMYDMTSQGLQNVFHGFGAMTEYDDPQNYFISNNYAPTLRANFNGNNHVIHINMDNSLISNTTGFFNDLYTRLDTASTFDAFKISNVTFTGSVNSSSVIYSSVRRAGMVAGGLYGDYHFENINVEDFNVNSDGNAGGLIGKIGYSSYKTYLQFKNCAVRKKATESKIAGQYVGGLCGYVYNGDFVIDGLEIDSLLLTNSAVCITRSLAVNIGSVFGYLLGNEGYFTDRDIRNVTIKNCNITGYVYNAGGAFGMISGSRIKDYCIYNLEMLNNKVNGRIPSRTGKVCGYYNASTKIFAIKPEVVYEESVPTSAIPSNDTNRENSVKTGNIYMIYLNPFTDLERAEELYHINRADTAYGELLATDILTGTEDSDGDMLVKYSAKSGMIQSVIENILCTLTNNTATLTSDVKDYITTETFKVNVTNGIAAIAPDETPSIKLEMVAGQTTFQINHYDTKDISNLNGTYSIIRFTYHFDSYTDQIEIPIYVDNMVDTDVYTKIKIGKINNPDEFKTTTQDKITITNDSSYTIYSEFVYGNLRLAYDVSDLYVNKNFTFTDNVVLSKGSRLTLIDLTIDGKPIVYYYTVNQNNIMQIPLEDFVDVDGNHYQNRDITKIAQLPKKETYVTMTNKRKKRVGVERYLLQVDNSLVNINTANTADTKFRPRIEVGIDQNPYLTALFIRERFAVDLTTIEGRYIKFKPDCLSSEGAINKNVSLKINAAFINQANDTYKNRAMSTDSVNNGKYIDIAMYLLNEHGDKILFPVGTMVKMSGNENYSAIHNTSVIYYYKDSQTEYPLTNSSTNDEVELSIDFDFSTAKMETLAPGDYRIGMDLIRTSDKLYPFGGETLDSIQSDIVKVTTSAEYGIAIQAKDYKQLAVNKAEVNNTEYQMNFDVSLSNTLTKGQLAALRSNSIDINFDIYKQDQVTGEYKETELSDLPIIRTDFNNTGITDLSGIHVNVPFSLRNYFESTLPFNQVKKDVTLIVPSTIPVGNYKIIVSIELEGIVVTSDYAIFNIADIDMNN